MRSRLRSGLGGKLATGAGATLLALALAEGLARIAGVPPEFGRIMPIHDMPTREVDGVVLWTPREVRYDGADIQRVAQAHDAFTIVGLGDSIMYGVGQPKEATFLEQARRALAAGAERPIEVLNLAGPGYNTRQEDAVYKEIEHRITPNLVIVNYWVDDHRQYRIVGGYVVDIGDVSADGRLVVRALPLPPQLSDFLLVHSRVYDRLTSFVVSRRAADAQSDWARVATSLEAIHERARRHGARLLILDSPELHGAAATPTSDFAALQEFGARRGVEVIDVSRWLGGIDPRQIAMDGCHFNAEGHRIVGERLAEYLLQHDLKAWRRAAPAAARHADHAGE